MNRESGRPAGPPSSLVGQRGAPLAKKLGVTANSRVIVLDGPPEVRAALSEQCALRLRLRGKADVVVAFFGRRSALDRRIDALARTIFPDGGLWIAWPKQASGRPTDLSDGAVRQITLARGLVDNKVCAVDDTWSARARRVAAPASGLGVGPVSHLS